MKLLDTVSCAPPHEERWSLKLPRRSEKQAGNSPRTLARKRTLSLESLEVYEVTERVPDADLEAAETVLAQMLVDQWLRTQGESMTEADVGQPAPNEVDLQEDKDGTDFKYQLDYRPPSKGSCECTN